MSCVRRRRYGGACRRVLMLFVFVAVAARARTRGDSPWRGSVDVRAARGTWAPTSLSAPPGSPAPPLGERAPSIFVSDPRSHHCQHVMPVRSLSRPGGTCCTRGGCLGAQAAGSANRLRGNVHGSACRGVWPLGDRANAVSAGSGVTEHPAAARRPCWPPSCRGSHGASRMRTAARRLGVERTQVAVAYERERGLTPHSQGS